MPKNRAALPVGSEGCNPGARGDERNDRATHTMPRSQCAVAVGRRARGLDDAEDRVADAVGARAAVATTAVAPKRRRVD